MSTRPSPCAARGAPLIRSYSFEEGAMKSRLLTFSLTLVLLLPAAVARGQLAPPNDAGVTMGQLNLRVRRSGSNQEIVSADRRHSDKGGTCCPTLSNIQAC